jgi:tRNA-Thr(GGU) m(6)t(6)A37 methyltransferase TsaA
MDTFNFISIGIINSCYKEKFGIPRQPNLVDSAQAKLYLNQDFSEESVRGLEGFSHIWLSFVFHDTQAQGWKPMVRPPRLGGNKKVGIFASRSTFRPNPLGLSVVELTKVEHTKTGIVLSLAGCDLLDDTPIVDIKPYLSYVDAIPDAKSGFAQEMPDIKLEVNFSQKANQDIEKAAQRLGQDIKLLIKQVLQLDPRPSYQQGVVSERVYAMKLCDFDLKWIYSDEGKIEVLELSISNA